MSRPADSVKEESRSRSPHCPKPDESEEPLGTAMETGAANDISVKCENETAKPIITKEMEDEEKKLMEEGERKEKEMMEKARQTQEKESHDLRFKRLQHLLQKSNIYSKFLLTKMEQQQSEENVKKERVEKKAKKNTKGAEPEKDKKKRKRDDDYKIADVMSKEEILSQAKKAKKEQVVTVLFLFCSFFLKAGSRFLFQHQTQAFPLNTKCSPKRSQNTLLINISRKI
ncbi:Lymphoid-specific helicase [Liparis tanakae]|uniref:Lymphoid-specific helicase n=1 Tax=Liparis tanakae TaxID=230148 RepID=A0A4Z2G7L1_9TELE|nr:Lymphoid-specific helicase [Liparis tanakae]